MKSSISAEWIGKDQDDLLRQFGEPPIRKPWCAEVTLSRKGFYRRFLSGSIDYQKSNSKESRGVFVFFILEVGKIYELKRSTSWSSSERVFLKPDSSGAITEGTKEEAEKWLSNPLA